MSTEIVNQESRDLSPTQMDEITTYLKSLGTNLSDVHTKQFITLCREFQLNPLKREIYGIAYGNKFNIIVGYEVYLQRAEMTGKLDGWERGTEGEGSAMKAWVKIHRKDWSKPFYHEVDYSEYVQRNFKGEVNQMWATKPRTMLMKVAAAQAFRLAFPSHFAGMPYTSDEMPTGGNTSGIVHNFDKPEYTVDSPKPVNVHLPEKKPDKKPEPTGVKMAPAQPAGNDPNAVKRNTFWNMMVDMFGDSAPEALEEMTAFKTKDGKQIRGKRDLSKVSDKQIAFQFKHVEGLYNKWKEKKLPVITQDDAPPP